MEYTQWVIDELGSDGEGKAVLILVVMEYTQWDDISAFWNSRTRLS